MPLKRQNNKKLISVVVAVYNVEKYIAKCIDSLLAQSYGNLEIILVDDGSTDHSGEICDAYAEKNKAVKVLHKENGGLSSARNTGIACSNGELIGFVDGDDIVDKEMYDKLYSNLLLTNSDISICGRYYVYGDSKKIIRYNEKPGIQVMDSKSAIKKMNSFSSFDMAAWDKLYKRALFNSIKFPENKLSEDYFIMYKLFLNAERICYTPEPLYYYVQRQNSISHTKKINYDFIEAAKQQMVEVEKIYPELKDILHTAYASANMTVYDFYLKQHMLCPYVQQKKMQGNVKKNLKYIRSNTALPFPKILQAFLFVYSINCYNFLFRFFKLLHRL